MVAGDKGIRESGTSRTGPEGHGKRLTDAACERGTVRGRDAQHIAGLRRIEAGHGGCFGGQGSRSLREPCASSRSEVQLSGYQRSSGGLGRHRSWPATRRGAIGGRRAGGGGDGQRPRDPGGERHRGQGRHGAIHGARAAADRDRVPGGRPGLPRSGHVADRDGCGHERWSGRRSRDGDSAESSQRQHHAELARSAVRCRWS
jgi:hypothetical protein